MITGSSGLRRSLARSLLDDYPADETRRFIAEPPATYGREEESRGNGRLCFLGPSTPTPEESWGGGTAQVLKAASLNVDDVVDGNYLDADTIGVELDEVMSSLSPVA